jgi:protocatechuate 3,4-dioxygenase, alpha subunit
MSLRATPSQTVGPYFHLGMTQVKKDNLAGPGVSGENVTIRGGVFDGDGNGVSDSLVELWQADAQGHYAHPEDPQAKSVAAGFRGFGRVSTDAKGTFTFTTVKPGRVPGPGGGLQAPHIVVIVFARGLLKHLITRIYFPDEASNAEDAVLQLVPGERRCTLIAKRAPGAPNNLEWNVVLQGEGETVFFDA